MVSGRCWVFGCIGVTYGDCKFHVDLLACFPLFPKFHGGNIELKTILESRSKKAKSTAGKQSFMVGKQGASGLVIYKKRRSAPISRLYPYIMTNFVALYSGGKKNKRR